MAIVLPSLPREATWELRNIRGASTVLRPAFGGPRLPLSRKGDHWALDVDIGGLDPQCAEAWAADLAQGDGETLILALPKLATDPALVAEPVVFGAGQAGSVLNTASWPPGYAIRKGRMFSILTGGRRYLHRVRTAVAADGAGAAQLAIWPMLRVSPAHQAVAEFQSPKIEGFVEDGGALEGGLLPIGTIKAFTLEERA